MDFTTDSPSLIVEYLSQRIADAKVLIHEAVDSGDTQLVKERCDQLEFLYRQTLEAEKVLGARIVSIEGRARVLCNSARTTLISLR